ncbi:SDR family NAD(P)-dependent oxidoreductase [Archangium primigenium]|nr:SDR family NAD(P)-dependent oxidoreductase [Archangium primigenium]
MVRAFMASAHFQGRVALITGASSGIGRATALAYAARGAQVLLAARRESALRDVAREVEARGGRALAVRCDVTREDDVARLLHETRAAFGGLDVLVNNAGLGLYGPVEGFSEAQLRQVFEVNFFALVRVTQAALPLLRARAPGAQLTLPGRLMVLANRLAPGLFDAVARRIANPARAP